MIQEPDVAPEACVLKLPVELAHQIFGLLDIRDILALRKTCKYFNAITRDRAIWVALYNCMRTTQPLPCTRMEFESMSYPQFERALVAAAKTEKTFLVPRERTHFLPHVGEQGATHFRLLSFISDRFLLSADFTTVINLWDVSNLSASQSSPYATISLERWRFTTYAVSADNPTINVVVCRADRAQIYSIRVSLDSGISDEQENRSSFVFKAGFELARGQLVRYIDPDRGLALIVGHPFAQSFDVLDWRTNKRSTVPLVFKMGGDEYMWNAPDAFKLCGPYVLCIRFRSIDAYPLPAEFLDQKYAAATSSLPVLHSGYFSANLISASLSGVRLGRCSDGEAYTVYMLVNEIFQGMLHYQIVLTVPQNPTLSVRVLGMKGLKLYENIPVPAGEDDVILAPVTTHALGSVGLHGIWVEKRITTQDRRVFAFTTHPSILHADESEDDLPQPVPRLKGKMVAIFDVDEEARENDDICAVSELTGQIALGMRSGGILISNVGL